MRTSSRSRQIGDTYRRQPDSLGPREAGCPSLHDVSRSQADGYRFTNGAGTLDPAGPDHGAALAELALVDEHTLRDLPQHSARLSFGHEAVSAFASRRSVRLRLARAEDTSSQAEGCQMPKSDRGIEVGAWMLENGHRVMLKLTGGRYPENGRGHETR